MAGFKMYSGLPGSGKTAQLVADIMRFLEKEPERPIYALGINGLVDGFVHELTPEMLYKWWELPVGSIICIDEVQEPHLMPADRGNPPEWIRRLSKWRHYGMDWLVTTQRPNFVSSYVRGLVDSHVHFVRKFNTHVVQSFTWGMCVEQPRSKSEQKTAIQAVAALPRHVFSLYKSSSLHNMKRRIPRKVYYLGICAVVAVAGLIGIPFALRHAHNTAVAAAGGKPASASSSASAAAVDHDQVLRYTDYARWMRPRVPGLPWTAPAFDKQEVRATPRIFCIAVEDLRCQCNTEQGTRYEVDAATCRSMVQNGVYNPFVDPEARRDDVARNRPAADEGAEPRRRQGDAPPAETMASGSYKDRATSRDYQPPEQMPHESFSTWSPRGGSN